MTTHTHRFDDAGICSRCGIDYATVIADREAQAVADETARTSARADLDATAKLNDAKDRRANRRSYYERTGR